MFVDGLLDLQGTVSSPVVFTAYTDDSYGGDTDHTSTQPAPGNHCGSLVIRNSGNTVHHTLIQYGGGYIGGLYVTQPVESIHHNTIRNNTGYGIYIDSGSIDPANLINNNVIRDNDGMGIYISAGNPTINNNNIFMNTQYGVNNTSVNLINARNNWWGHASGP